jgi:hypothetical protein
MRETEVRSNETLRVKIVQNALSTNRKYCKIHSERVYPFHQTSPSTKRLVCAKVEYRI